MHIRIIALGSCMAIAGIAQAQTATVNFTGDLLASTCSVSAIGNGGSSGGDATVILPPVASSQLASNGARAGRRTWQILVGSAFDPCLAPRVQLGFRNNGNVNAQGRLNNIGSAANVDVVVSNAEPGSGLPDIDLRNNGNSQVRDIPATGWVALTYASEYYAKTAATGGTVITSVQYDLIYP